MTTAIEQPAKHEHVNEMQQDAAMLAQAALTRVATNAAAMTQANAAIGRAQSGQLAGINPLDFVTDNRINIKHGSLFIDPYLVVHPRELAPENEAKLREKLKLTFTVNNPSFYESYERVAIALNLGQLIPVSLTAKHSKLTDEIKKYNAQVDSGADADLQKLEQDKRHPFAAIVRDTMEKPARDPIGVETLKNGLSIYLLMREKLTSLGYLNPLSSYVARANTPDQVLGELADKIGVSPLQVREAALKGGLEGVGQLLKLDPAYVAEVKQLTNYAATQDFGFNIIEHWHLGRQLLRHEPNATFAQKLSSGLAARITGSIENFRSQVKHHFDVPEPIKAEEKRIAGALNLLEPIQRALMHKLGYEICYTPEFLADDIARYRGIYGLHRKAASDLRDTRGTYRIYFSGRDDLKGSMRTLVHEVAHNLWPEQFSPETVQKIDTLTASDDKRFHALHRIMSEKFSEFDKFLRAYQAGNAAEKAAIAQTTREYFKPYGVSIDEGLLPYLRDASELRYLAAYAVDTLTQEGARYAKSGYDSPQERMREIISRFAELKQVELSGNPQLMQFLAPGLNQVWETHYIPHLKRVYQQVVGQVEAKTQIAEIRTQAEGEVPKVEQRPVVPAAVKSAGGDACTPDTVVDKAGISVTPMLNENAIAALGTLNSMGIHPR